MIHIITMICSDLIMVLWIKKGFRGWEDWLTRLESHLIILNMYLLKFRKIQFYDRVMLQRSFNYVIQMNTRHAPARYSISYFYPVLLITTYFFNKVICLWYNNVILYVKSIEQIKTIWQNFKLYKICHINNALSVLKLFLV